jgi:uncharacterized OsmC-like protein
MFEKKVNEINVDKLADCKEDMRKNPELGKYTFRAKNKWLGGAHCKSTIKDFCACGEEVHRKKELKLEGDEPKELLGHNHGPNATEALLHALGACLNASFIYHASEEGIEIDELEFELEGDLDLNGFMGTDENVPPNFQQIRVKCKVKADASKETLQELCQYAQKRSPVFNSVTRPVPVQVALETHETAKAATD